MEGVVELEKVVEVVSGPVSADIVGIMVVSVGVLNYSVISYIAIKLADLAT